MGRARMRCGYAHTLFNLGSLGGLSDGELHSLFASRRDQAGEVAIAVLVERHGSMVHRVGDRKGGRETYDQALWIAAQNPPAPDSLAYQCLSGAKARVGDWSGVREFAIGQTDSFLRATHAEAACFEQAKAGETRDALAWALGQTDPINRARALLGVARGMMEQKPIK